MPECFTHTDLGRKEARWIDRLPQAIFADNAERQAKVPNSLSPMEPHMNACELTSSRTGALCKGSPCSRSGDVDCQ